MVEKIIIKDTVNKIISKEVINKAVDTVVDNAVQNGSNEIQGIFSQFAGNYIKRKNTGFSSWSSLKGSWRETTRNINARLCGRETISTKEAIIFDNAYHNK